MSNAVVVIFCDFVLLWFCAAISINVLFYIFAFVLGCLFIFWGTWGRTAMLILRLLTNIYITIYYYSGYMPNLLFICVFFLYKQYYLFIFIFAFILCWMLVNKDILLLFASYSSLNFVIHVLLKNFLAIFMRCSNSWHYHAVIVWSCWISFKGRISYSICLLCIG